MKAKELMIEDWVYIKTGAVKRKCRVNDVSRCGEIVYYGIDANEPYREEVSEEYSEPIPLTPEILEKNGFKNDGETFDYRWKEEGCSEDLNFYLRKMYNADGINDSFGTSACGVLPVIIKSVHELQHALRICGLNDLADNFRI